MHHGLTMNTYTKMTGAFLLAIATIAPAFAQNAGAEIYREKCQMCHGASGMGETAAGRAMKVRPVNRPEVSNMSDAEMVALVNKGSGKMQSFRGSLSEAQIKEAVQYFRGLRR